MRIALPSILITDDDRDFRETLKVALEPRGFRTWLASDGEEALEIIRREDVHVALMDMHMPKLTGLETIRRVREFKSRLPCILLSGNLDELLIRQAHMAEAFSVLAKPITRMQLNSVVDQALERIYNWSPRPTSDR